MTAALNKILSEYADDKISDLETALTCRAASNYLGLKIYEETSLAAILKSIDRITSAEFKLFIRDLPNLLRLPYPFVKEIRFIATQIISQAMYNEKMKAHWRYFVELDYLNELLKSGVV